MDMKEHINLMVLNLKIVRTQTIAILILKFLIFGQHHMLELTKIGNKAKAPSVIPMNKSLKEKDMLSLAILKFLMLSILMM